MEILISNPLPAALRHFELELSETLARVSLAHSVMPTHAVEDKSGPFGQLTKLGNAIRNSRQGSASGSVTIHCWPSLGLLEPIVWTARRGRSLIIFHDPVPIRKQVGFDRISRSIAASWARRGSPEVLVHSDDAFRVASQLFPRLTVVKALHPILSQQVNHPTLGGEVVVAGQFKPERNVELLVRLGPMLKAKGLEPKIYGRGWPTDIPGWSVDSRFLSEPELDAAVDRSAVVLIPYRNYFQSGIAIRALERGRISVSPENSFAKDVFGEYAAATYRPDAKPEMVLECLLAVAAAPDAPEKIFSGYKQRVDSSWTAALNSEAGPNSSVPSSKLPADPPRFI